MSLSNPIVIGANNYAGLETGRYIRESSTADEPILLSIDSTIKPDGQSSFAVKIQSFTNVASAADKLAQVHVVYRWDAGVTQATLDALFTELKTMMTTPNVLRIMRGER